MNKQINSAREARLSLRVPQEIRDKLESSCIESERNITQEVIYIIRQYYKNR